MAQLTVVIGLVLGVLVTITSVGAGALRVVALVFLYPHMPTHPIVTSDLVTAQGPIFAALDRRIAQSLERPPAPARKTAE